MTLISDLQHVSAAARGGAVSVGNFDGVHRGHAELVKRLVRLAADLDGPAVVMTFDPHPAALLRPGSEPVRLTEIDRRSELLHDLGVDHVVVCQTTHPLLRLSAREFFDQVLIGSLHSRGIVEGPNFFFGRNRQGDVQRLAGFCRDANIACEICEPTLDDRTWVSSTEIRRRIAEGRIEDANPLLTAPYQIRGTVSHGDGRGAELGFPTANLHDIQTLVPAPGVYATRVEIDGHLHASATHIGPNLTFGDSHRTKVETHVIDFSDDLYGRRLKVDFLARVRDIARFDSIRALIYQLHEDVATARRLAAQP